MLRLVTAHHSGRNSASRHPFWMGNTPNPHSSTSRKIIVLGRAWAILGIALDAHRACVDHWLLPHTSYPSKQHILAHLERAVSITDLTTAKAHNMRLCPAMLPNIFQSLPISHVGCVELFSGLFGCAELFCMLGMLRFFFWEASDESKNHRAASDAWSYSRNMRILNRRVRLKA